MRLFPNSIRWNLQMWLAFLLICLLSSFGVVIYQLQSLNRFWHLDEELHRRLSQLSGDVRTSPLPDFRRWHPHGPRDDGRGGPDGHHKPGGFDFDPGRARMDPRGDQDRPPDFGLGPRPTPPPDWPSFPGGPPDEPPDTGPPKFIREIRVSAPVALLFNESTTNDFYYAVWGPDGAILKSSTNSFIQLQKPADVKDTSTHIRTRGDLREAYLFTGLGECVLVGKNTADERTSLSHLELWILAAGGTVLLLGLGVGWWLTVRALKPIEEISAAASRISSGLLSERIRTAAPNNEIGQLAGVLNSTFARLETAFAQQKQFTADASHELRTPLAVIVSEAQTTLSRERSPAEYRETIEVCLDAAKQMAKLTQSLLELARYDAGQENIEHESFDLSEKVGFCVEMVEPLARERAIEIQLDLAEASIFGDSHRIRQVIINLLSNAIQYNRDAGQIRVRTYPEVGSAVLVIADTGCGIGPEDLKHAFERFYRADKARARSQGHCGLGLAICKTIVDAHGGTIDISSELGVGTTLTVRLPSAM